MKTHLIENKLLAPILVVELPKGEKVAFGYYSDELTIFDNSKSFLENEIKFEGNWQILGKPDEIKGEDVKYLVGDYLPKYFTAFHKFFDIINCEIYWENPFRKPDRKEFELRSFGGNEHVWDLMTKQFNEAETRTFDKSRTIILKKCQ